MQNLIKITFTICFLCLVGFLSAQNRIGPKLGLNLSTLTLKSGGISAETKSRVGFHFGMVAEVPVNENLAIQPGILFSQKGSNYEIDPSPKISLNYLEIPVNIVYKFPLIAYKFLVFGGPYLAYGINGKANFNGKSNDITWGTNEEDDFKPIDLGLNIGAGIEINNLQITAQGGFGLLNLATVTDDGGESKVRAIGISAAYLFDLNKKK